MTRAGALCSYSAFDAFDQAILTNWWPSLTKIGYFRAFTRSCPPWGGTVTRRRKAGHRCWGARGGRVPGRHSGDIMSPEKRSRLMARITGTATGPERSVETCLITFGLEFERHAKDLPGRPDFVFRAA